MKAAKQSSAVRKKETPPTVPVSDSGEQALANARLAKEVERLQKENARLVAETEQRAAELAIINSVQEGLASKLDVQAVYDLVGDKIRDIFHAQGTAIYLFDHKTENLDTPYCFLKRRFEIEARPFVDHPIAKLMVQTAQPIIYRTVEEYRAIGGTVLENSDEYKSGMYVPLLVGKDLKGMVGIANLDKEYAYDDGDLRLLRTLANSMSVALENARLFDETQRLLRETEQRNAELAIINSVQEGLASKLEFQSIIDLVGDQVHAITNAKSISIALYDKTSGMLSWPYWLTFGKRIEIPNRPLEKSITQQVMYAKKPLNLGTEQEILAHDAIPPQDGWTVGKSYLGVPFTVGNVMLGALSLHDFENEHAFNESDERLLQTLANSMSLALENARLFDETEQRAAELQIINSVQEGLASKLDIQAIYELVGDKIREIFPNADAEIRIYDPRTNVIQFPYITDMGTRTAVDAIPLTDMGISAHILRTGKTLVINENIYQEMAKYGAKMVPGGHPAKSAVFVPLVVGKQARGLIVLGSVEHEHAFSPSDVRLLQTLASSMSTALENARLFDETQRLLKETEQRNVELAMINSVQQGLASKLDMQAIYDLVGDKIRDLLHAQSVWIITFEPATRTRRVRYSFENGQRYYPSESFPYNKLTEHLIATKKPLVINQNFPEAVVRFEMVNMAGTQEQIKSIAYIPILAGEEVQGFISLPNKERENAFSESDVNLLSTFALAMSIALENIRLFDETQRLFLEAKEARIAAEQADQAKGAFLSSMSHELRTPLNAIINFVEMVARGMIGPVNQEQVELLDQALHSSKHLLNLINDVLDISKIQAGQLTLFVEEDVSAQVEVEATLNIVGGLIQEKRLQLVRDIDPHLPLLSCDRRRLRQVLLNLVSNALKFTKEGTITVSVKDQGQNVLFAVIDTGTGIAPDKQDLIFQPFLQAETGERQVQGTGLGLPISRSLIRAHGGELWLESEPGAGSAFFFTLPVQRRRRS